MKTLPVFLFCFVVALSSCLRIAHKKHVINPYKIGDKLRPIRTDGYYYNETESKSFPYYRNATRGFSQDSTKPYLQKQIRVLSLCKDGSLFKFGLLNGFQENWAFDFHERCGLDDFNSVESAKRHFECYMKDQRKVHPIWDKGVFKTENDSIVVQYYVNSQAEYFLVEKRGRILNDSSFILTVSHDYYLKETEHINQLYKFQHFDVKPDSTNYITRHKKRFKNKN